MNHSKRLIATMSLLLALILSLTACGTAATTTTAATTKAATTAGTTAAGTTAAATTAAATTAAATTTGAKPYIAVVSKGFQHQFWQVVKKGADAAAAKYNVTITFEGPPSESDIQAQVQMLDSALAKKPVAIALAALSTESVNDHLKKALAGKIPVIGFDSGVPNAPAGSVYANASTNNTVAGALAATSLYAAIKAKAATGTVGKAVRIAVLSQDAVGESVTNRTKGFTEKMVALLKADGINEVAVVGHDKFKNGVAESAAKVVIDVGVAATTSATDISTAGKALLNKSSVIAIYGSNEAAANGILDSSNEGADLKTKGIAAVGFDAGKRQKAAVSSGIFLGSITQDPYNIGYLAVELAYKAYKGEKVADVDTGAKFYTKDNINNPEIKDLVYD